MSAFAVPLALLAFCSARYGDTVEVWVAAADGSGAHQLTHGPGRWQCSPQWSPDDHWVAFDSHTADGQAHIWTVDADGGEPHQVTKEVGFQVVPTWSSDGHWIYYSGAPGDDGVDVFRGVGFDIWRVAFAGGQSQRLTWNGALPFARESHDRKSLLYQPMVPQGNSPLVAVPLTGGPTQTLVACVYYTAFTDGS